MTTTAIQNPQSPVVSRTSEEERESSLYKLAMGVASALKREIDDYQPGEAKVCWAQIKKFDLSNLTTLSLANRQLTILCPEIYELPNLKYLDLSNNQLQSLPSGQFPKLKTLNISKNRFTELPCFAPKLEKLDASDNLIASLPTEKIDSLRILHLNNNRIKELPETFLHDDLEELHLENNQITNIPSKELPTLSTLSLLGNPDITQIDLPLFPSLRILSLSFSTFRSSATTWEKLEQLFFDNVPLSSKDEADVCRLDAMGVEVIFE